MCGFDIGCHIGSFLWSIWDGIGIVPQILIIGGLLMMIVMFGMRIIRAAWNTLTLIKQWGGWGAIAGAGAFVAGVVLAVAPKVIWLLSPKKKRQAPVDEAKSGIDAILPDFKWPLPPKGQKKRRYDTDTNTWI